MMEVMIPSDNIDIEFQSARSWAQPKEYYFSAPTSPSQYGHDFAFDVTHDWKKDHPSAADLFDGGVIKPLKPPPRIPLSPPLHRGRAVSKSRAAQSLSPIRDNVVPWEEEDEKEQPQSAKGQKKWRLKDFFLFRSASEGRAADRDPLKKYTRRFGSRRRGPVSAHELHYIVNRAVSEDLKKKTFLPYKQGILGRLAFNPAAHALANGFGFARK